MPSKKTFLAILSVALLSAGCSENDFDLPALPDPSNVCSAMNDDVFKCYCLYEFDTDNDGKLSQKEADEVTTIAIYVMCPGPLGQISFKNMYHIKSFKGIEYFRNLEEFLCGYQETSDIDLSRNGNLRFIDISTSAIETLDLSKCTKSEEIYLSCANLRTVKLPVGITKFLQTPDESGNLASLYKCPKLTSVYCKYSSPDNRCIVKDGKLKYFASYGLKEYTLPTTVTSIAQHYHSDSDGLELIIPPSVTEIEELAFYDGYSLESITFPESIRRISNSLFYQSKLPHRIYCKATTPPEIAAGAFNEPFDESTPPIYVPMQQLEAYKSAPHWDKYADQLIGYDF